MQSDGKIGVWVTPTTLTGQLQVGDPANYNSSIASFGSDFRIGAYNSSSPVAFLQARDNSTRAIGLTIRIQQSGGAVGNAMTIQPDGKVGIGINPSYRLDVNGDIATYGTLRISSDFKLKSNINQLSGCLERLNKLMVSHIINN